jgi:hypothetical protein
MVWPGSAWLGLAGHGKTRNRDTRGSFLWRLFARFGKARQGEARLGMAGRGRARLGSARQRKEAAVTVRRGGGRMKERET